MHLFLGLLLIGMSLIIHELSHALAMQSRKIPIKEIGIGLRLPYLPVLRISIKKFGQTTFYINHLPLLAYVRPTEEGEKLIEGLSYTDKALIYGAGLLGNIFFAFVLWTQYYIFSPCGKSVLVRFLAIVVICCLLYLSWRIKTILVSYLFPLFSLATLVFLGNLIFSAPTKSIGGPITIVAVASQANIIDFGIMLNISLALFNALPIFPLDGGRIIAALIERQSKFADYCYKSLSVVFFIVLIAIILVSDIVKLLGR